MTKASGARLTSIEEKVRKKRYATKRTNRRPMANNPSVGRRCRELSFSSHGILTTLAMFGVVRRRFHGKESSPLEAIRELG